MGFARKAARLPMTGRFLGPRGFCAVNCTALLHRLDGSQNREWVDVQSNSYEPDTHFVGGPFAPAHGHQWIVGIPRIVSGVVERARDFQLRKQWYPDLLFVGVRALPIEIPIVFVDQWRDNLSVTVDQVGFDLSAQQMHVREDLNCLRAHDERLNGHNILHCAWRNLKLHVDDWNIVEALLNVTVHEIQTNLGLIRSRDTVRVIMHLHHNARIGLDENSFSIRQEMWPGTRRPTSDSAQRIER